MATTALPPTVALVDETGAIDHDDLVRAAGALTEQVMHDFRPIWHVPASVQSLARAGAHQWGIVIKRELDEPGALGYHTDEHNQPISYVMLTDDWSTTVSHELLEMLADPWGNRMHGGRLPSGLEGRYSEFGLKHRTSQVSYLLEVCDPCERTTYDVAGVAVSDFLLPHWYAAVDGAGRTASFAQGTPHVREVADGGYVSFAVGRVWWQVFNQNGSLDANELGTFDKSKFSSLREFTDHHARQFRS